MHVRTRRRPAGLLAALLCAATLLTAPSPPVAVAVAQFPCMGAPPGEPAGGMYPEPRIFFESQSWWTQGEPFPGRHIHTGVCIPWMQPVDGIVQYNVRNLLHEMPGTETMFRLQVWGNGPDPAYTNLMSRSCAVRDCTFWDTFTLDYTNRLPGRWEHRFTNNIDVNAFGARQFTTTRWHICVRTCVGGSTDTDYLRSTGAAGWYAGLNYANAYLDPNDYARLRDGVPQGQQLINVKFDQGFGSVTVDPDAHNGKPGIVMCRISDGLPIGGFTPVATSKTWFGIALDTSGLSPGIHKLALRGSNANAIGYQEGVLVVPFRVLANGPPQAPVASFTANPTTGVAPVAVAVSDTTSNAPTSWTWDFGDGSPTVSGPQPPAHTYPTPGSYTISLTATNAVGSSTASRLITIDPPPRPVASFNASPLQGGAPLDVTVQDTSTGPPTSWSWDFGDGSPVATGRSQPAHTYDTPGNYTITLTAANAQGSDSATRLITVTDPPPPTAAFTASPTQGVAPLVVSVTDHSTGAPTGWLWDFGDSSPAVTGATPQPHQYDTPGQYTITLTASNAQGDDPATRIITVTDPPPPTAAFAASPTSGTWPLVVTLTDQSTDSPDSWHWDFGDGTTFDQADPGTHTYGAAGPYDLTLTVTNAHGIDSRTRRITVTDPPPPTATFTATPTSGNAPLAVTVTDSSTGAPTSWLWDFGDGATAAVQSPPAHTYTTPGPYTIKLTATNDWGSNSATRLITVNTAPPPRPTAAFTATPTSGNAPLAVTVTDASAGTPTTWSWNFGDGTAIVSGQQPAAHTYTTAGTFTITLTAGNAGGSTSATTSITVNTPPPPAPTAAFTATPISGNAPLAVTVSDASTGAPTSWSWDFGDGATSTVRNPPAHTYTAAGSYTITLTATNAGGNSSANRTITVTNAPPTTRIKDVTFDPTLTDAVHGADRMSGTVTRETAAPLAGPGSARVNNAAAYVEESFTATNDLFVTFRIRLTATPPATARVFMISNGGTTQGNLLLQTNGKLRLRVGSTNIGLESITLNATTTYIVGVHQRRGTGANAVLEAWVAPVGTAFGAPFASRTNGTWTTAADRVAVGGTNGAKVSLLIDNLLLDSSAIPLTPLP